MNWILRITLAALISFASPSCSLVTARRPRLEPEDPSFEQARSMLGLPRVDEDSPGCLSTVAPGADAVFAFGGLALSAGGIGIAASTPSPSGCPSNNLLCGSLGSAQQPVGWTVAAVGAITALFFTTSAVIGYVRSSGCRATHRAEQ